MGFILRIFPRNLCRIKNNKKTELQEKLTIVTGLCASREESQTQKFGIDHLRWEGGLAAENSRKTESKLTSETMVENQSLSYFLNSNI